MSDLTNLQAEVVIAYSDTFLKDLTNVDGAGTTVNTTKLESACKAAIGRFQGETRFTFDSTDYEHMEICVGLTRLELLRRAGQLSKLNYDELKDFMDRCNRIQQNQTVNGRFESFGVQTTGNFDNDDWDDFR